MFLHKENQQLLWETLQKTPYLVEFTQKFSGHREEWYRGILEQFFTQWISQNGRVPTNARELLEINKSALQFMVADLKRLLGYQQLKTVKNPTTKDQSIDALSPYNVAEERKRKEDTWSANFNQYQSEYNRMLEKPVLPMRELPSETGDEKIKNMEELLREHAKMRDMDLTIYTPAPMTASVPNKRDEPVKSVIKLKILDEIQNVHDTIENVHDAIDTIDAKTVRFDLQDQEFVNEPEYSSASQ
jgi:hypothetical protein